MAYTLVPTSRLEELSKVGFTTDTIKQLNTKYNEIIRNTAVIEPISNLLARARANDIARWSIDYSMGIESRPRLKIIDQVAGTHIPIEVAGPLRDPIGPIAAGILPQSHGFDTVKTFMSSVTISSAIRSIDVESLNLQTLKVNPIVSASQSVFAFNFDTTHLLRPFNPEILRPGGLENKRPDWELRPEEYNFPTGFPRTHNEKELSVKTISLLDAFVIRTTKLSAKLTERLRNAAPNWRLPTADGVDWQNLDARFGYLGSADSVLTKADLEARALLRDSVFELANEAALFLSSTRQYLAADPKIFEQYWQGQLQAVMYQSYNHFDLYMAKQRHLVDSLKTQLSQLDYQQAQSDQAAREAQKQQDKDCGDFFTSKGFWSVVGIVTLVIVLKLLGGTASDSSQQDPNDPGYRPPAWDDGLSPTQNP